MQYYQFHIGDYTTATVHLQPLEDLAYRRLIDFYYMKEAPIPTDIPWVSRRLRLGSDEIEYVLNEFFTLTDNGWENERCNADIKAFNAYKEKQRANGKKGGRPQKNPKKPTANPPKTQVKPKKSLTSNHKPETNNQSNKAASHDACVLSVKYPEGFNSELIALFKDWADIRREARKYLTERAITAHFKTIEGFTPVEIAKAYNDAIASGWQSVHPKKISLGQTPQQNIKNLPTQSDYEAEDDVTYDENGEPVLPF